MKNMLLSKPKLYFFGYKILRFFDNEEQIGVIRSYMRKMQNNIAEHCWNIYYPFYKDSAD